MTNVASSTPDRLSALVPRLRAITSALEGWPASILDLIIRLWMANVFWRSGLSRVNSWDSQSFLFTEIHPVPGVPASLAAPVVTAAELVLPVLLAIGLLSRLSALGLLVMTLVIQFVVGQTPQGIENGIANPDHYLWALLFGVIILHGPGRISLDHLVAWWFEGTDRLRLHRHAHSERSHDAENSHRSR